MKGEGYSPVEGGGVQRTDMDCHHCNGTFIAELNFSINGQHVVECPRCGHQHFRVITDGKITEERWKHKNGGKVTKGRSFWKSDVLEAQTSVASTYLRNLWLNRSQ